MNWDAVDWKRLEVMREIFLAGTAGHADYWLSDSDLVSYDATFAQRIGWKWDFVLEELRQLGWTPTPGPLVDWGCGTGIAHRAFLDHFGTEGISCLRLADRSPLALRYAERKARNKYPKLPIEVVPPGRYLDRDQSGLRSCTLLVSHVLTELPPDSLALLADAAGHAASLIWVEPGTFESSLNLIAIRERLRSQLHVVAPCTHRSACGLLSPGNESHWCHHFATPPPHVFVDSNWARFARMMGIDLRSLPLSYLVLDHRLPRALPEGAIRIVGRPRVYKPFALLLGCGSTGVKDLRLSKRSNPVEFRLLRKGPFASLQVSRHENGAIKAMSPLLPVLSRPQLTTSG